MHEGWQERVNRARTAGNVGDLLLLADEAPTAALRADAWIDAAELLRVAEQYDFALEQVGRALALDAGHARALREQALCRQGAGLPRRASEEVWQPRQVLLFSGHMVDAPDRPTPRFPAEQVPLAAGRIAALLEQLGGGPQDLGLTQGACGGDLLFSEACRQAGVKLFWLQPFAEADFIAASVLRGSADWHRRYLAVRAALAAPPRAAPEALGPNDGDPYERCNRWLLYTALAWGADKLTLICLWDGGSVDGPGGTAHMYEEVRRRAGRVAWIDTRSL
jgi:hypothetical protein